MLTYLQIKNFALIEDETIEFSDGFSVILGETGSGKSLVLDAIQFVLGARTNNDIIRPGYDKAEVTAQFDVIKNSDINAWLEQNNFDSNGDCVVSRVIKINKGSKCQINGNIVSQKQLKYLQGMLMQIHSQHDNFKLFDHNEQRNIIDQYGKLSRDSIELSFKELSQTKLNLTAVREIVSEQQERLDIINYHLEELNDVLVDGVSYSEQQQQYKRFTQIVGFNDFIERCVYDLSEKENSITSNLECLVNESEKFTTDFSEASSCFTMLLEASVQLQEAARDLKAIGKDVSASENDNCLEEIINKKNELARKHNVSPDSLVEVQQNLQQKRETILAAKDNLIILENKYKQQYTNYLQLSSVIHNHRVKLASELSFKISKELQSLGMPDNVFKIMVEYLDTQDYSHGKSKVTFLFSANPGHAISTIDKVASGGELSRISLVLECLNIGTNHTNTIVFDEVDSGVSGKIAKSIAVMLSNLSKNTQIIVITHSPQIASMATTHFFVDKDVNDDKTYSKVKKISAKDVNNTLTELFTSDIEYT